MVRKVIKKCSMISSNRREKKGFGEYYVGKEFEESKNPTELREKLVVFVVVDTFSTEKSLTITTVDTWIKKGNKFLYCPEKEFYDCFEI